MPALDGLLGSMMLVRGNNFLNGKKGRDSQKGILLKLYKATKNLPNATVIKDAGPKVNQSFIEAVSKGHDDKARKKID
jgi:hypothetical protein